MLRAGAYRRHIENRIRAGNTARALTGGMTTPHQLGDGSPGAAARRRRPARSSSSRPSRSPRPRSRRSSSSATAVAPTSSAATHRRCARRGRRRRPRRHDGLRRRDPGRGQPRSAICSRALRRAATDAADDGVEFFVNSGWRSPAYQEQLLRRGGPEVRLGAEAARWVATAEHVRARVGGRGRHRAGRRHGVAVRARRRVRAVPDLPQRALALRAAPRGRRSRLPAHVRRPDARSEDAAVNPV